MKAVPNLKKNYKTASWVVYILSCGDGTLYTGITNNLVRRLEAHQSGAASRYTRSRLPVKLAYAESAVSRSAALRREAMIKRLRREQKEMLIKEGRPDDEQ